MPRAGKFAPISKRIAARTPSAEVERSIVDAAERLLVTEGPEALTVRGIASEAGVATASVYNHLGGKQGILDALLTRGFDDLHSAISVEQSADPVEDLAESGRRYREWARKNPQRYALMFEPTETDFEPSQLTMGHAFATFKVLESQVRRAVDMDAIAPGDPAEIAQRLWSLTHGMVSLELHGMGFCDDLDTHQEATCATMLRGLATTD